MLTEQSTEIPLDADLQELLTTLHERIIALIARARQGNSLIEVIISNKNKIKYMKKSINLFIFLFVLLGRNESANRKKNNYHQLSNDIDPSGNMATVNERARRRFGTYNIG